MWEAQKKDQQQAVIVWMMMRRPPSAAMERGLKRNQPGSWTYSLQNGEKINFCCLNHSTHGICYGSPSKLIQHPQKDPGVPPDDNALPLPP